MLFFYLVALPVVACATLWALLFLPSRTTGWLLRLDVGLAWLAALAALVLVPADVAAALARQPPGPLAACWKAAYWYGFLAQVLVLPLHMEFTRSGEFSVNDRLLAAARTNLMYYAVLLCVALAGLVLLLFSGRLQPANILGFGIAFSNAYGLVAAIFLLGFGLVAVPRQLWNSADQRGEQRRVCHSAGLQAERALAAHRRLSAAVLTARRASVLFSPADPLRPLMEVVLQLADSAGPTFVPDPSISVPEESDLDIFDRADLARLRRELKAALMDWEREQALYAEAVQEHLRLQAVVASLERGLPEEAPLAAQAAWLWRCHLHFWAFRLLATLAALCSLAIVVAEATIAGALPNMSVVSKALHATSGSLFATELLCFAFLAYPCACAYYALYRLGRFAFYRMVPRHTDAYSLCYSGLLMCRFAAPLAFNFMAAVAMPEVKGSDQPDVTDTSLLLNTSQLADQPRLAFQDAVPSQRPGGGVAPAAGAAPGACAMDLGCKYELIRDIGSGNFGVAKLCRAKDTGELVAVKFIERGEKIDKNVEREIINHRMLSGHPNIVRFREVFLTSTHLGIAMEYASGGELFDRIVKANRFSEDEARYFFQQLISGVAWCHREGVCHRDLKLENTLLDGRPAPRLKICDFGYSKSAVFDSQPKSTVGTPAYIAPEVLSRKQYDGEIADVWSCGVTLYVMLVGAYPFEDPADPRNFRKTIQRIMSVKYSFPANLHLSRECLDLISRIFVANPAQRISIAQIKQHPWFLRNLPEELKDGGIAMKEATPTPSQTVEEIRSIVNAARTKAQTPQPAVRDFNEEDYMDGDLMDEELVE